MILLPKIQIIQNNQSMMKM